MYERSVRYGDGDRVEDEISQLWQSEDDVEDHLNEQETVNLIFKMTASFFSGCHVQLPLILPLNVSTDQNSTGDHDRRRKYSTAENHVQTMIESGW